MLATEPRSPLSPVTSLASQLYREAATWIEPPSERTPEQEYDYQRCLADAEYFICEYWRVKSDRGLGVIPFALFDYQRSLLHDFLTHQQLIILKARQLGITELLAAYSVWKALRPRIDVVLISQGEDEANEILNKARLGWDNLPDHIKPALQNPTLTSSLVFANGSRLLPKPSTARAGRSFNAQLLVLDEWAHQVNQEAIYAAAAASALSADNQIIGLSSANGVGNLFHRHWLLANEGKGAHPVFLPWDVRPGRDQDWYDNATKTYEPWQKAQEFPKTPHEAFILSGRPRFDPDALTDIAKGCIEPLRTESLGTTEHGRAAGYLRVWAEPVAGRRYVAGADTAEGLPKGDYSTAVLLDWETGQDVAELHGHWAPEEYAHHLAATCKRYNDAFLGVERNNHGHAVLLALEKIEQYRKLYHHSEYDAKTKTNGAVGWQTSSKSKPIMVDALAQVLRERRGYRNAAFISEARTYAVKDNGDTGASGSLHDDRVISYAIAEQMRKQPVTTNVVAVDRNAAVIRPPQLGRMPVRSGPIAPYRPGGR